ncbi:MFS transporter [Robbsia sp. KACC 23696]|uniref:MFS transporter n=1 Tax=Robbsia sp. KACC 23696 TaxID=3149231 RepID=UPI00325C00EE
MRHDALSAPADAGAVSDVATTAAGVPAKSAAQNRAALRRLIVASSIGNALEWFDFAAYGFFAVTIAKLFFPTSDATVSLLLTFGTFGASYLFRPFGALVLGHYADRHGRKSALLLALSLTTVGTLICTVIPTYADIGVCAPLGLMLARFLIAFSTGGEFGSGTALMVEQRSDRKAFLASWQFSSQGMSTVLASAFGLLLSTQLSHAQIDAWGWRIPFAFGLLIAPVGLYIRRFVDDTLPTDNRAHVQAPAPMTELFAHYKGRLLLAAGILSVSTAASYLMILYMPTYAVKQLHLPASTGFAATVVTGLILMVLTPIMGHYADRFGRARIMRLAACATLLTIYPCFKWLLMAPSLGVLMTIMVIAGLIKAVYFGPLAAVLSSLFPTAIRSTGLGFGYNVGVMVFGGFTPWLVTILIAKTGDPAAPSFYLMGCAVLSLICIGLYKRLPPQI